MAYKAQAVSLINGSTLGRAARISTVLVVAGLLGACAQISSVVQMASLASQASRLSSQDMEDHAAAAGRPSTKEIQEGLSYWGSRFARNPADPATAIAYASNLRYVGQKEQALAVLQRAMMVNGDNPEIASSFGRLALEMGKLREANDALARADVPSVSDWRTLSARGAVLAQLGQHGQAIEVLNRAAQLKPDHPPILNNLALAHALAGNPSEAELILAQARLAGASDARIARNLQLIRSINGGQGSILGQNSQYASSAQSVIPAAVQQPGLGQPIQGAIVEADAWDTAAGWGTEVVPTAQ